MTRFWTQITPCNTIRLCNLFMELKQLWENPTCKGQLICPEGHVSSLNKCNPIQSILEGNTIHLTNNGFTTELFVKPTASHSYVHKLSCHPIPIFPTLPCGEILQAHRNCIDLFMCDTFSEILLVICWGYDPQQASPKLNKEQFLFIRCLILIHILWWIQWRPFIARFIIANIL